MVDVPDRHLGKLHELHNRGPRVAFQKSEVSWLLKQGLVAPAGERGQYGMTHYKLTSAGVEHARNVVLEGGKYSVQPGERSPELAPIDDVPPGYLRTPSGKILKVANDPHWKQEG